MRSKEKETRTDLESMKESGSCKKKYSVTPSWKVWKETRNLAKNTANE